MRVCVCACVCYKVTFVIPYKVCYLWCSFWFQFTLEEDRIYVCRLTCYFQISAARVSLPPEEFMIIFWVSETHHFDIYMNIPLRFIWVWCLICSSKILVCVWHLWGEEKWVHLTQTEHIPLVFLLTRVFVWFPCGFSKSMARRSCYWRRWTWWRSSALNWDRLWRSTTPFSCLKQQRRLAVMNSDLMMSAEPKGCSWTFTTYETFTCC